MYSMILNFDSYLKVVLNSVNCLSRFVMYLSQQESTYAMLQQYTYLALQVESG